MRSLIRTFASRLNILWVLSYSTDWTPFGVSKLQRRLHKLVWVYTCLNSTLFEITCRGPYINFFTWCLKFVIFVYIKMQTSEPIFPYRTTDNVSCWHFKPVCSNTARILKFCMYRVWLVANNKDADQTAWMWRLFLFFVCHIEWNPIFLRHCPYMIMNIIHWMLSSWRS